MPEATQQSKQTQSPGSSLTASLESGAPPAAGKESGGGAPAGGSGAEPWLNVLPAEYRTDPNFIKFKNIGDFAKSYRTMESIMGKSVRIPDDGATPQEVADFRAKLGVPEKPDGYEIKFAEGVPVDEKLLGSYLEAAHKAGIPKSAAQELAHWWANQMQGSVEGTRASAEQQKAAWDAELRKEWGYAHDRNLKIAGNTLGHLIALAGETPDANHPLVKMLNQTGMGDHPAMIRFFHKLAAKFGEDAFLDADQGPSAEDVASAKARIAELRNDAKGAYWDGNHPGHKDAVEEMKRLNEIVVAGASGNG